MVFLKMLDIFYYFCLKVEAGGWESGGRKKECFHLLCYSPRDDLGWAGLRLKLGART